jgi:hypothetical protein
MLRIILTYGLISGVVIIAGMVLSWQLTHGEGHKENLFLGYLIMLVALSTILVGVRQYRDQALGGVIKFGPAFGVGLGIALAASVAYVATWEVYLATSHTDFIGQYTEQMLAAKRAAHVTGAAYQKALAEAASMRAAYANPLTRMGMTFIEIFPVGLVVALVSAFLLRNPRFLPARRVAA